MKDWGPPVPARARWEFTPDEANGLALAADEVVGVWPTESSWWFARKPGGAEGYVPRSFVRVEDDRNEAYFSAAGARSPVATRRSRHRAKRGPKPGRRTASVRLTATALDMVWVVTCCLLAVAPVALIGRWITADPPGMAIPAASMRKPPASKLFSSAARVCFGPGACHDPNTLLSGGGGAEARPLWRNASSMLGPGARRCCPNCTRGLKSCTASHVEEHLFVERILPLLDARVLAAPTFLEIGGQNGVLASNTIYLQHCLGWHGILVEAAPHLFRKLVRERPSTVAIGSAICRAHSMVSFSRSRVQLSITRRKLTLGPPSRRRLRSSNMVPCGPLGDYLALLDIKNITFFSLDVEGFELQVLRSIDWGHLEVAAMVVEELQISEHTGKNSEARRFLLDQANLRYLFSYCPPEIRNVCDAYFINPRVADLRNFSQEGPVVRPVASTRECSPAGHG